MGIMGVILGLYGENGKENGSYYLGFRGLRFLNPSHTLMRPTRQNKPFLIESFLDNIGFEV